MVYTARNVLIWWWLYKNYVENLKHSWDILLGVINSGTHFLMCFLHLQQQSDLVCKKMYDMVHNKIYVQFMGKFICYVISDLAFKWGKDNVINKSVKSLVPFSDEKWKHKQPLKSWILSGTCKEYYAEILTGHAITTLLVVWHLWQKYLFTWLCTNGLTM